MRVCDMYCMQWRDYIPETREYACARVDVSVRVCITLKADVVPRALLPLGRNEDKVPHKGDVVGHLIFGIPGVGSRVEDHGT
jgi:hypothetical protein